jgi:hypothetical protein
MAELLEDIHGRMGNLERRVLALEAVLELVKPGWRDPPPHVDPVLTAEGERALKADDISGGVVTSGPPWPSDWDHPVSSGGTWETPVSSGGTNLWLEEAPVFGGNAPPVNQPFKR